MDAFEINDGTLAVARDGAVLSADASGMPLDGSAEGGTALWRRLRRDPRAVSLRHFHDLAQLRIAPETRLLVQRELRARAAVRGPNAGAVWLAVGARYDVAALGELLALARNADLDVAGFVDTAAASAAWLGGDRPVLVIDASLFDCCVSLVSPAGGGMQVRRSTVVARGEFDLLEAWLALLADAMVRRTRFDPLHDGMHEQQLFDRLPALVAEARERGSAAATVQLRPGEEGESYTVELTEDQLAAASQSIVAELLRALHELRPAGSVVDIVVPREFAAQPGFVAALQEFSGCDLVLVPQGFGAAAASQLAAPSSRESGNVSFLRRVAGLHGEPPQVERRRLGEAESTIAPTHLLFAGGAHAIGSAGIVIGRAPGAAQFPEDPLPLRLPEGLAGVSRRHATVLREAQGVALVDHSTHGSFVNDERVAGRRLLAAGDRIRFGTPGIELAAIRVS